MTTSRQRARGPRGQVFPSMCVCVRGGEGRGGAAEEAEKRAIEGDKWVEWRGEQGEGQSVWGGG